MERGDNRFLPWVDSVSHALVKEVYQGSYYGSTTSFDELVGYSVTRHSFPGLESLNFSLHFLICDRGVEDALQVSSKLCMGGCGVVGAIDTWWAVFLAVEIFKEAAEVPHIKGVKGTGMLEVFHVL